MCEDPGWENAVFYCFSARISFTNDILQEFQLVKMPISRFNALLKLLRKVIAAYRKTKNQLNMALTILLYKNGYPAEWDEEVFEKVMAQQRISKNIRFSILNGRKPETGMIALAKPSPRLIDSISGRDKMLLDFSNLPLTKVL